MPQQESLGELVLRTEQDTDRLGRLLSKLIPCGTTFALCGTLGAGKTRLAQAMAAALDVDRSQVTSPTFTLVQTYHGTRAMHHLDAYRVKDDLELLDLGIEEMFDDHHAWTVVEWADRYPALMPDDALWIAIELVDDHRIAKFAGQRDAWQANITRLLELWAQE